MTPEQIARADYESGGDPESIVRAVRPIIAAEALRAAAEHIEALPPGGEALSGPYWYRSGLTDAAAILRDRADEMSHR
ncbi:hypothetical protein [Stackebrandtia soli]|uniref:hypothetical protein n=1 Tax=Stackebrandtia soli TaxID=1892856 RepID=UPI0039E95415